MNEQALTVLRSTFGFPSFRGMQEDIISHVCGGGDALVLMPTGGGKSLCYQVPALIRRGTAVVVSPLIALMQDQVEALRQLGVKAAYLNSSLGPDEARAVFRSLMRGEWDLLYVAPERLFVPQFLELLAQIEIAEWRERRHFFAGRQRHVIRFFSDSQNGEQILRLIDLAQ